jgi:hypothetical protein
VQRRRRPCSGCCHGGGGLGGSPRAEPSLAWRG